MNTTFMLFFLFTGQCFQFLRDNKRAVEPNKEEKKKKKKGWSYMCHLYY
jgi:hypothetical protein